MNYKSIIGSIDPGGKEPHPEDRTLGIVALLMIAIALLALFACGSTRGLDDVAPVDEYGALFISDGGIQTVAWSDRCGSILCETFGPWRRVGDTEGEVRWLVSMLGSACLINDAQYALAGSWERRRVRCAWRPNRPFR